MIRKNGLNLINNIYNLVMKTSEAISLDKSVLFQNIENFGIFNK